MQSFPYQGDREGRPYHIRTIRQMRSMVGATLAVALAFPLRQQTQTQLEGVIDTRQLFVRDGAVTAHQRRFYDGHDLFRLLSFDLTVETTSDSV